MRQKLSTRIKRQLRLNMYEFCVEHLKTDYRTFQYRMRSGRYYPAEVVYICWLLNDSCENIFGQSFSELVLLRDGPGNTVEYIKDRFAKADDSEKRHLMELIGFALTNSKEQAQKSTIEQPIKGANVPVEKPKEPEESKPVSFEFIDINLLTDNDVARYGRS